MRHGSAVAPRLLIPTGCGSQGFRPGLFSRLPPGEGRGGDRGFPSQPQKARLGPDSRLFSCLPLGDWQVEGVVSHPNLQKARLGWGTWHL